MDKITIILLYRRHGITKKSTSIKNQGFSKMMHWIKASWDQSNFSPCQANKQPSLTFPLNPSLKMCKTSVWWRRWSSDRGKSFRSRCRRTWKRRSSSPWLRIIRDKAGPRHCISNKKWSSFKGLLKRASSRWARKKWSKWQWNKAWKKKSRNPKLTRL